MYPIAISKEICDAFIEARPRGWAFISENFYIRQEILYEVFRSDQKLWYYLKKLVRIVEKYWHGRTNMQLTDGEFRRLQGINPAFRAFCQYWFQFSTTHSDELDYFTYVKREKPV
jgi:hypothetical protein